MSQIKELEQACRDKGTEPGIHKHMSFDELNKVEIFEKPTAGTSTILLIRCSHCCCCCCSFTYFGFFTLFEGTFFNTHHYHHHHPHHHHLQHPP
uniref:Uncharacterized protein n=1 Tax=Octopus bimaculoides TaxID=37653 RepID=A0A0L8GU59_OCTBM